MASLRVVSLLDAAAVTGPAKNLIQFCRGTNASKEGEFATEVSIATISRVSKGHVNPFVEAAREAGIQVDVMEENCRYDPRVIGQLKQIIRDRSAGIIETHGVRMHFLARFSGLAARIPWIAFHHGYTAEDLKMLAYNQLDRWSLRKAACVFTDCRPFADELEKLGIRRERIRVLGSSIQIGEPANPRDVQTLREQLRIEHGESVILSVGRLSREKAQNDLIAAAGHLHRINPQWRFRLVLVGDGPERERLEVAAAMTGLPRPIVFAGQQKDVRPYFGIAQLFVLPSKSEGSPNVLLEAMAAGVPIVSTAVGGVPEMIEHEWSGLLAPAGNPEALAQSIERLMVDPALAARLAGNAAVTVRERFSPDAYRRAVEKAYSEVFAPSCS
jgi:glycosyltransferase involved in cell wall biosynthesis